MYGRFSISDGATKYKLTLGEPTIGTLGTVFHSLSPVSEFNIQETGWLTNKKQIFALHFRWYNTFKPSSVSEKSINASFEI